MPNDWLNDHSHQGGNNPEHRKLLNVSSKRPQYPAGVAILKSKSKLDSKEPKAHDEYLEQRKPGFGQQSMFGRRCRRVRSGHSNRMVLMCRNYMSNKYKQKKHLL